MRRPGFEPGFWAWKAQVIATRPSTQTATHLEVFVIYILFASQVPQAFSKNCLPASLFKKSLIENLSDGVIKRRNACAQEGLISG